MAVSLQKGTSMSVNQMEEMAYQGNNNGAILAGMGLMAGMGMLANRGTRGQLQYSVGLGWDVNRHGASMDLDAWALAVDFNDKNEMVYFGNKKDKTRNIVHTGDNLTGAGSGDDETINIDLAPLTNKYKYILLGVTIYGAKRKGQSFANVRNAFVRVYDRNTRVELCRYSDSFNNEFANCSTLVFGAFINDNGTWRFKAVGQPVNQSNGISDIARLLIGAALLAMVNISDNNNGQMIDQNMVYADQNNVGYADQSNMVNQVPYNGNVTEVNNINQNNNLNGGKKTMAVSLSKGGKVSLAKVAADAGISGGLTKVVVGLGWNPNAYDGGGAFDLDAAAFLTGSNGKVRNETDFVFYGSATKDAQGRKCDAAQSVIHTGDNRTGEGDGDDEQILIDLTKVPEDVQKISFTCTIDQADVRNQNFGMVSDSYVRVMDEATGTELIRYDLGEDFSVETAIVVAEIYRHNGEWKFNAVGAGFAGGLAALCGNFGIDVE